MHSIFNQELIIATHNLGKAREIGILLAEYKLNFSFATELQLAEPEETGSTFSENAAIKAKAARDQTSLLALADDSGLVIPALNGAPGIYSARWAGPNKDFKLAISRIEQQLGKQDPAAYFVCSLALAWPDGECEFFEGRVHGTLVFPPRGENGFGYDPIFRPHGIQETFGEMAPKDKDLLSHRSDAFKKLVAQHLF